MDVYVLDKNFQVLDVIDTYESIIWTERFIECGDFELYLNYDSEFLKSIMNGYYLQIKESKTLMIIEDISTERPSPDDSIKLVVKGRCLKSILYRRIIWGQTDFNEKESYTIEEVIKVLLDKSIINPKKVVSTKSGINNYIREVKDADERKIDIFIYVPKNPNDPDYNYIQSKTLTTQYNCQNLGEEIISLCQSKHVGCQITFEDNKFYFTLKGGIERQDVVFSPNYDNLVNTSFKRESKDYRNITIIAGIGNEDERFYIPRDDLQTEGTALEGLDRFEMFTDCSNLPKYRMVWVEEIQGKEESEEMEDDEYVEMLREKGDEDLKKNSIKMKLEGEIIDHVMYTYGVDYFLGDIVTSEDEFGNTARSRVTEYIICVDSNGYQAYPTFSSMENEKDEEEE